MDVINMGDEMDGDAFVVPCDLKKYPVPGMIKLLQESFRLIPVETVIRRNPDFELGKFL